MDIAALIFAPFVLALIYSRPGIVVRLPFLVRVALSVGLLVILFIAFISYIPAVQEAVTTRTPLVRDFGGRIFPIYMDGLSLLFALVITGIGALITLYASAVFEEGEVYQNFVQTVLLHVGLTLALVLTDSLGLLPFFLIFPFFPFLVFLFMAIRFGTTREEASSPWPRWKVHLMQVALFLLYGLVRFGITLLTELGGRAHPTEGGTSALNVFSSYNLSKTISYELFFILIFMPLILCTLGIAWQWRSAKNMPMVALAFLPGAMMSGLLYFLARFYPAIHDNPLWWSVVTGIGLVIMLIGAVWSLRQTDPKAILIYRSMSALGACIALLGLPEFLGVKVALIGIVVHALSLAALFLTLDNTHKQSRLIIIALALLPMAIFHLMMIGAFYQLTLAWSGIALAVVVLSTALWGVSMIRILFAGSSDSDSLSGRPIESPRQSRRPMGEIATGILAMVSLVCVVLFDPIFVPLLYPAITAPRPVIDTTTPLILGLITLIGGGMLYATRDTWERFIQTKTMTQIDNVHEH